MSEALGNKAAATAAVDGWAGGCRTHVEVGAHEHDLALQVLLGQVTHCRQERVHENQEEWRRLRQAQAAAAR